MGPLWSISIEEQFYLLWPWIVRICSRRVLAVICVSAWICSQASLLYLCHHHALNNPAIWTSSLVQLQYFAIGIGLSLCLDGSVPTIRGEHRFLIIIAAFLLFPAAELLFNADALRSLDDHSSIAHTYPTYLLGGVSVLAILIGFLGCGAFESWRGVRYLGKISYGLYVYHPIAIGLAGDITQSFAQYSLVLIISGLLADICIAWLSYEYFEKPFIQMKERFAIVKSRAA
jgi:peptidoglycan/LPS O-acetylase OafA/YrhL